MHCYGKAIEIAPDNALAHWNRGLRLLAMGDLDQGWEEYDWGLHTKERALSQRYSFLIWDGSDLSGKTILVYAEQGVGDEVLFASCLADVIERAERCVVQCDPRLAPLFSRSFPQATVHGGERDEEPTWLQYLGRIDVQCPLYSIYNAPDRSFVNIHIMPVINLLPEEIQPSMLNSSRDGHLFCQACGVHQTPLNVHSIEDYCHEDNIICNRRQTIKTYKRYRFCSSVYRTHTTRRSLRAFDQ